MKKADLPQKICLVCNHPFTWRKKWEKNWSEVKYCSKRCASNRHSLKHKS
ncbi:zinc finger protein [Lentisphaera araneosa HTCC2155]|uniref:Zinc finger protein n=1 Tax=Lentisphaera araneosa HTCC2155 TaxID=313628 RepID=A6DK59_9BACT|nr:zinc finger protein [Lentisphaera araneosa HTCC2155]